MSTINWDTIPESERNEILLEVIGMVAIDLLIDGLLTLRQEDIDEIISRLEE